MQCEKTAFVFDRKTDQHGPTITGACINKISLRILGLEEHLQRRTAITQTLTNLGVRAVLHAAASERAIEIITSAEGVDIVVCNLSHEQLGNFDFLLMAGKARLIHALVLWTSLEPALYLKRCMNAGAAGFCPSFSVCVSTHSGFLGMPWIDNMTPNDA